MLTELWCLAIFRSSQSFNSFAFKWYLKMLYKNECLSDNLKFGRIILLKSCELITGWISHMKGYLMLYKTNTNNIARFKFSGKYTYQVQCHICRPTTCKNLWSLEKCSHITFTSRGKELPYSLVGELSTYLRGGESRGGGGVNCLPKNHKGDISKQF